MVSYKALYQKAQKDIELYAYKVSQYDLLSEKNNDIDKLNKKLQLQNSMLQTELQNCKIELNELREKSNNSASTSNYTLTYEKTIEDSYGHCESINIYNNGCFVRQHVYDSEGKKMESHQILLEHWKDMLTEKVVDYYEKENKFSQVRQFIRENFPKHTCPSTIYEYNEFVDTCYTFADDL